MAQQIKKKYIQDGAVDGSKLKLLEGQSIVQESSEGDVELIKLDNTGKVIVSGKETAFKEQVEAETSARESAINSLQSSLTQEISDRQSADSTLQSNLDAEESARQTADSNLQSAIDVEKGRIDSILLASDADKDSFKEIVDLINSVDTENDAAFAGYVASNDAALAQEVSDRQSADSDLQDSIDAEASARQSADQSLQSSIDSLNSSSDVIFEDSAATYADGTAPVASPKGHDGWYYISAGSPDKINWYFFSADNATVTIDNFTGMYAVGQVDSSNGDTFHLAYYTVAQGDGNDAGSWYRSRQVFIPNGSFSRGKKCLFYVGQEPSADFYPDLERVEMTLDGVSSVGLAGGSEVLLTAVLGTNSVATAGSVEILMNRLGFNSSSYNKEYSLEIEDQFNLSGIKQSILEEIGRRQKEDSLLEDSLNTEISNRQSADNTLQSNIDSEEASRIAADTTLQSNIDSEESSRIAADNTLQSNIDAEQSARISGDSSLQGQIDTEKGRIDAILLASDADKDSFAEIVSLINSVDTENDNAFAAYVLSNDAALAQEVSDRQSGDSTLQSNLDSESSARQSADNTLQSNIDSEESARIAADSSLQSEIDAAEGRLDSLEARAYKKEKFTLTSTDISNGYVDLGFEARENSIRAFVGRLAIHEGAGEDYTVSVVGGVTRVTFVGNMVNPSEEQLTAGDVLHFSYEA